jgi:hypothetical protein
MIEAPFGEASARRSATPSGPWCAGKALSGGRCAIAG